MGHHYDVTLITVRPGAQSSVLAILGDRLSGAPDLRACWHSELGTLNQVLLIREAGDAAQAAAARLEQLNSGNPLGIGEFATGLTMDTYVSLDVVAALRPGEIGPYFEVRTYLLKPDGLAATTDLWRKAVPGRVAISPLLTAMVSISGPAPRFIHIWPYKSLDERGRLRSKAIADGVWPPPGGAKHFAAQQSDIYVPAAFSPIR